MDVGLRRSLDPAKPLVRRHRLLLLCLILLLGGVALYANILTSYFLADDFRRIGRAVEYGVYADWQRFMRPVVVLSFVADVKLWHLNPLGYHLTNLFLHVVNAFLVVCLSTSLLRTAPMAGGQAFLLSSLAGLLFLALPSHTESVSWISGRTDLIATCLMLCSLLAYCAYGRTRQARSLAIALAAFVLALLAKESAVSLPFVVLAFTILFAAEDDRRRRLLTLAMGPLLFFGVLASYALLRYRVRGVLIGGYGTEAHLGLHPAAIVHKAIGMALRTFLPPLQDGWAHVVETNAYLSLMRSAVLVGLLLFAILAVVKLAESPARRRLFYLLAVLGASFWATAPLLGTQTVSLTDTQGERFLYMPSVFASIGTVYALSLVGRVWQLTVPVTLALIVFCAVHTHRVNENWRLAGELSRTLVDDIARRASHSPILLVNVPDNYNGAYVLRNGLAEAVRIFGGAGHVGTVRALSLHGVRSATDEVSIVREGAGSGPYQVRLQSGSFLTIADDELAVTRERSKNRFVFDLRGAPPGVEIMFYSAGRMHVLAP
jgi:protein O-mannosyl-transferase